MDGSKKNEFLIEVTKITSHLVSSTGMVNNYLREVFIEHMTEIFY